MPYSLNRAQILGHCTRDPEMRYTTGGQSVTNFGVATNRRWTDQQGNQQESTEFHEIVCWGKLAEIATQLLRKGRQVYVEGRLQTRSWEGQEGAKRTRTEIVADNIIALGARPAGLEEAAPPQPAVITPPESGVTETPVKEAPTKAATPQTKKGEEKTEKKKMGEEKAVTETKETEEEINLDEIPF